MAKKQNHMKSGKAAPPKKILLTWYKGTKRMKRLVNVEDAENFNYDQ